MEIANIEENVQRFTFPPRANRINPYNAYLFRQGTEGILIDAGLPDHGKLIAGFLAAEEIHVSRVVISHYDLDHFGGYVHLPKTPIIGSGRFQERLASYAEVGDKELYEPSFPVHGEVDFEVAGCRLQCLPAPGHTPCSLVTIVNDRFVHVGDYVINSESGEAILPLGQYALIEEHISTLERLRTMVDLTWLLGHGVIAEDRQTKLTAIEERLKYLMRVRESKGEISREDALQDCSIRFGHLFWHERNLRQELAGLRKQGSETVDPARDRRKRRTSLLRIDWECGGGSPETPAPSPE